MSTISTHVLDTSLGKPAEGFRVTLHRDASLIGSSVTDADGRARGFLATDSSLSPGDYPSRFQLRIILRPPGASRSTTKS